MKLYYEKARYAVDDTLAIRTWWVGEYGYEPYGDVTVNLSGYGMTPDEGYIFIPKYKMTEEYYEQIVKDIIEEVVFPVRIGYGTGVFAKLKDHWEDNVEMMKGEF